MADVIRVVLADDHPVIRDGIGHLLDSEPDMTVVGKVGNNAQLEAICREVQPDVVLLDLLMPSEPPLQVIRRLLERYPSLRVVIFSAYEDYVPVQELLQVGVAGYVHKDERPQMVVQAVRAAYDGSTLFSGPVLRGMQDGQRQEPLTSREREVLQQITLGWTSDQIASELCVTERTVRYHLSNIYSKLGVSGRAEAVAWAVRRGFGSPQNTKKANLSDPPG